MTPPPRSITPTLDRVRLLLARYREEPCDSHAKDFIGAYDRYVRSTFSLSTDQALFRTTEVPVGLRSQTLNTVTQALLGVDYAYVEMLALT